MAKPGRIEQWRTELVWRLMSPAMRSRIAGANKSVAYSGISPAFAAMIDRVKPELSTDGMSLAIAAETSEWIGRCLDERGKTIAMLPWRIVDRQTGEPVEGHQFHYGVAYLFVNHRQDFFYDWQFFKAIHGKCFFESVPLRGNRRRAGAFFIPNPLGIDLDIRNGEIVEYVYSGGDGQMFRFSSDQMYMDTLRSAMTDLDGSSPVMRAIEAANIDRGLQHFVLSWLRNGGRAGGAFVAREGIHFNEQEQQRILDAYNQQTQGANRAFTNIFLPFALDYKTYENRPPVEQAALEESQRRRICTALSVPMSMVDAAGVSDPLSAGSTFDGQKSKFYENWAIPEAKHVENVVNAVLLPRMDPRDAELVKFEFDTSEVLALIRNTKDRVEMINTQVGNVPILTINQARAKMGEPEIEGADVFAFPGGTVLVPADQLARANEIIAAQRPSLFSTNPFEGGSGAGEAKPKDGGKPALPSGDQEDLPQKSIVTIKAVSYGHPAASVIIRVASEQLRAISDYVASFMQNEPQTVRWLFAESFHITLISTPLIGREQLDAIYDDTPAFRDMALSIGPLTIFEQGDYDVIVLDVDGGDYLRQYQAYLYGLFARYGIPVSDYSLPENWKPHITLGYVDKGIRLPEIELAGNPAVKPVAVLFTRTDYAPNSDNWWKPVRKPDGSEVGWEDVPGAIRTIPGKATTKHKTPAEELSAWERVAAKSHKRGLSFECHLIAADIADEVRHQLEALPADNRKAIKAVFATAKAMLDIDAGALKTTQAVIDEETIARVLERFQELGWDDLIPGEDELK